MDREGPYLFYRGFGSENLGRGLQQPPWLDVLQKIAWLDEG